MKAHGKQWKWVWDCSTRQGCWLPDAAPTFAASQMGQYSTGKDRRVQAELQQQRQLPAIVLPAADSLAHSGYAAAAAPSARDEKAASGRALKIRLETARRLKERDAVKEMEKMEQERRFQQALEQRRAKLRVIEKNITAGPRVKVDEIVGGRHDIQISVAQRRPDADSASNALDNEIARALARADAVAGTSAAHSSRRFSANHTRRDAMQMPSVIAPPVIGYKKRVEQLRIQVDALRRVEAEEGDVDAVSRHELAHDLVEQQRSAVSAGLRKVQAWRVEAAVASAIPQFVPPDALESLDLDVAPKPVPAKPAPGPPPPQPLALGGYASRRPAPAPLVPSANHRKLIGAINATGSGGGSGVIVPGPAARVLMGSVSTAADDDSVDIAPPPRLQAAAVASSSQQQQQHHQQQLQPHHAQQPAPAYSLPPVKPRNFRAPSPLLEVEEEDLLSPMFDSLDLDVKARQVLPRLLARLHGCGALRCIIGSACPLTPRVFSLWISRPGKRPARASTTGLVCQCATTPSAPARALCAA